MPAAIAFLSDVDDTLFENDLFEADLREWLPGAVGPEGAEAYWRAHEARRDRLGYVDFLGAVQDCRDGDRDRSGWFGVGEYLLDYPFATRLYPGALELLAQLAESGPVWLVSDGDAVMQPHKLRRAGLWGAVAGRVRILIHKEQVLDRIARACPARHHVLIDDKPRILGAVKAIWGQDVTTVLPRQGHYALAPAPAGAVAPDIAVDRIGDLAADPRLARLIARHAPRKHSP